MSSLLIRLSTLLATKHFSCQPTTSPLCYYSSTGIVPTYNIHIYIMFTLKVITFFIFLSNVQRISADELTVKVSQGVIKGRFETSRKGKIYKAFTGIPYAKPPTGNLRFKEPVESEPWKGVLDATKNHNICPQLLQNIVLGNEDCLYLNVYTPHEEIGVSEVPVIFYIHGGGFKTGSGDKYWYGPDLLMDHKIIVVVINYRLGPLGFLTTEDNAIIGNNGLKDQSLALKWVKENIPSFGGDSNKISVVGHSSGAGSSHLFAFSPLTKGLFNNLIAQSGSAFGFWSVQPREEAIENSRKFAEFIKCSTIDNATLLKCLMEADYKDIIQTLNNFQAEGKDLSFRPVIEIQKEGAFLTHLPKTDISSGNAADVPFLTGVTSEDGGIISAALLGNIHTAKYFNDNFHTVVQNILLYNKNVRKNKISESLRNFYLKNKTVNVEARAEITKLFGDNIFGFGVDVGIRLHKRYIQQPVYYYQFAYRGSESHNKHFGDRENDYGVVHADELLYLFNLTSLFPSYVPTLEDNEMSDLLTTLWVNFATTSNPTPQTSEWKSVNSDSNEYYFIKSPSEHRMEKNMFLDRYMFLENLDIHNNKKVKEEL